MDLKKQKTLFLTNLRNNNSLAIELKTKIEKQVLAMDDEEFATFLKSIREIENKKDAKEKIAQLQQMEKIGHDDFLQTANEFSRKITQHESEKQEKDDKLKADALLNKIKSL